MAPADVYTFMQIHTNSKAFNLIAAPAVEVNLGESFYMHHFGITKELLKTLQQKYEVDWKEKYCGKFERFEDCFYDTKDFQLMKKNYWLRMRSTTIAYKDKPDIEWSLKTTKPMKSEDDSGSFLVTEWSEFSDIEIELRKILSSTVIEYCDGFISFQEEFKSLRELSLTVVEFFPTTRLVLEDNSDYKFYIDCSSENLSDTWFLLAGVKFINRTKLLHLEDFFSSYQAKKGYSAPVMSKIVQVISWMDGNAGEGKEVYPELLRNNFVLENERYSEKHIYSDEDPFFPLP